MVGGTVGAGVILLSLLMAVGLEGAAVIATDAVVSLATSIIKISVFGLAGVVTPQVLAFAIRRRGVAARRFSGAEFVAGVPARSRRDLLNITVITGGAVVIFIGGKAFALENSAKIQPQFAD